MEMEGSLVVVVFWFIFVFSLSDEEYIFEVMLAKSTEDHSNEEYNYFWP